MSKLKKEHINKDKKVEIMNKFLTAYENMRDKFHFPVRTPTDDLQCPICGGHYKRRDKSKHSRGKKHKLMLPLVLEGRVFPYLEWEETIMDEESSEKSFEESEKEESISDSESHSESDEESD